MRNTSSGDANCVIFQISTRLNYNQTLAYPNFAWAIGGSSTNRCCLLLQNGITQAQNAGGALQYVNELLLRSDEPFVRFFSGHFSSIEPSQHGLPLSFDATTVVGVLRPWLNSSFSGMRVKGAQGTEAFPLSNGLCTFLVDGSLSATGVVGTLRVFSERGVNFTLLAVSGGGGPNRV